MKPFKDSTNTDKAALLHELFPDEIPDFLEFAKNTAATIREDQELTAKNWQNPVFTFGDWLALAGRVEENIEQHGARMVESNALFARYLFDGHLAIFTSYCLTNYTTIRQHPNRKFRMAADLLFNP